MIPSLIVRELLISGVNFLYESYNHKEALAEMEAFNATSSTPYHPVWYKTNSLVIPDEIKKNHLVWHTGRVRDIHFSPKGEVEKVKIGKFYFKNFYLQDFGVRVKPLLFKSDDKYDLIKQGLAVEDSI